jgi:hypothetical protein
MNQWRRFTSVVNVETDGRTERKIFMWNKNKLTWTLWQLKGTKGLLIKPENTWENYGTFVYL